MNTPLSIATLSACAAMAFSAMAQDQAAAPSKPAMSASMPMDCQMMAKDGQGGMGPSQDMSMGKECAKHGKDTAGKAKTKAKPVHDHAKFHKNQ